MAIFARCSDSLPCLWILQRPSKFSRGVRFSSSDNNLFGISQSVGLRSSYKRLFGLMRLKPIRNLALLLVTCKGGTMCAESVAVFKLMDKGVQKESLSVIILLTYPSELFFAVVAGRWVRVFRIVIFQ